MKKITTILLALVLGGFLMAGNAMATFINPSGGGDGSEENLQEILNGIAVDGNIGFTATGETNDAISDASDSYWRKGGTSTSSASFIVEIAGQANTNEFGIYNHLTKEEITIFDGDATTGSRATILFTGDQVVVQDATDPLNPEVIGAGTISGNIFGFYLRTEDNVFYSDSSLNPGGADHMVAFQGSGQLVELWEGLGAGAFGLNEFILAWEDLAYNVPGVDWDYNDMVIMVESIQPIPEPATMLLLGLGVLGIGVVSRKKFLK